MADAKLATAPHTIRLVFSEEVVPALSQILVIGPAGDSTKLNVTNDPHDVHTLLGAVSQSKSGGRYTVYWRVVSADGHPVNGNFSFSVAGAAVSGGVTTVPTPIDTTPKRDSIARPVDLQNADEVPVTAAVLRGVGLGVLMAAVGILFFGLTARDTDGAPVLPRGLILWLTLIGAVLLVAHLIAWTRLIAPNSVSNTAFVTSVFESKVGRIELARTALAVLMLLSVAPLGNNKLAFLFGFACLLVSGAVGHPAAIHPMWAIPGKSIHLLSGAAWLGALVWLLATARADDATHQREAMRVSSLALIAVIAVLVSGLLQTVLFLNTPGELLHSQYGKLVVAKFIGLLILVCYGAYNRYFLLPRFTTGGSVRLRSSVRQEIFVMTLVVLMGGFLAYIPPPPSPIAGTSVTRGLE